MQIRRATPEDAPAASAIAADTFVETFGHLYPPADLETYLTEAYDVDAQLAVLEDPQRAVWLAEEDGEVIGHAAAGPCGLPHDGVQPGDMELKRLYLRRSHQGGYRGTQLLRTALDWMVRDGPRTVWLGVWSENLGAQRFYERHGFTRAGEYHFPVGQTLDLEFILRRPAER